MLKKKVLLAGFSAAKPSWYCLEASPVYCFETLYVLVLASSNFSINENNMFSALSDDRGYLSLLSFFLHHIKTIMGRVSVLIHINVPAIRKFSFKLEREKEGDSQAYKSSKFTQTSLPLNKWNKIDS